MTKARAFLFSCMVLLASSHAYAEVIRLHVPIVSDAPQAHLFFHDLLKSALLEAGYTPELITEEYPQLRIKKYLEAGKISVYWMLESNQRNTLFLPIKQGLTNGLIGKRILFIKKGNQHLFDEVETLEDFRALNLVGGMGKGWFDVDVWKANNLEYLEFSGNWKFIFKMVALGRSFDYFSRGFSEIVAESKIYPELEIEKRLMLIYNRDFFFYLSTQGENAGITHHAVLSKALSKSNQTGLTDQIVRKHWGNDFYTLNHDERIQLHLNTPQ